MTRSSLKISVENNDGEFIDIELNKDGSVDVHDYDIGHDEVLAELGEEPTRVFRAVSSLQEAPISFLLYDCEWLGDRCWGAILCDLALDALGGAPGISHGWTGPIRPHHSSIRNDAISGILIAKKYWTTKNEAKRKAIRVEWLKAIDNKFWTYWTAVSRLGSNIMELSTHAMHFEGYVRMMTWEKREIVHSSIVNMGIISEELGPLYQPPDPIESIIKYQKGSLCKPAIWLL